MRLKCPRCHWGESFQFNWILKCKITNDKVSKHFAIYQKLMKRRRRGTRRRRWSTPPAGGRLGVQTHQCRGLTSRRRAAFFSVHLEDQLGRTRSARAADRRTDGLLDDDLALDLKRKEGRRWHLGLRRKKMGPSLPFSVKGGPRCDSRGRHS